MSVLYIKDIDGKFIPIPTIKGDKGEKGKYFIPSLSTEGYLSFEASEPNEDGQYEYISSSISLKGPQGNPGKDAPSDVVRYNSQGLSEDQQNQARENIGAVSEEDVSNAIEEVVSDFGGTVEITSGLPQKTQTVLTIDPSDVTVNLYTAEEIDDMVGSLSEEIVTVNVKKYGAVGDGAADDSDAIQAALNEGGQVYLPAGRYKITKTLTIGSNTTLMGDGDNSVIFLGDDGANLTPHYWYPADRKPGYPDYYPYITTEEGATKVRVTRIRVEGNTEASSNNIHVGICAESASDVLVDHVSVWKINYFPELTPARPSGQWRRGWNIAFLRCDRVELAHSTVQYGAYECVRIGTRTNTVWVHDCLIEYGWRTGLQVIEACNDVLVERCTINQDDFDAYDTNACITLHASDSNHIGTVVIRGCKLTGKLFTDSAGGAGISDVAGWVDSLIVEDTTINVVAEGLPSVIVFSKATIRRCNIKSEAYTALEATSKVAEDSFIVEDTDFYANPATNKPAVLVYGNLCMRRSKINTSYDALGITSHNSSDRHVQVVDCDLHVRNTANAIILRKASADYGGISFEIARNTANNKIYLAQKGGTINRKCTIANNTITPPSGGRGVQCDSEYTTVYKLLHIYGNVIVQGQDGIKVACGKVVAMFNEVSGCTNGVTSSNANNVIENNFD